MEKAQKIKKTYSNKAKTSGKPMILTKQKWKGRFKNIVYGKEMKVEKKIQNKK